MILPHQPESFTAMTQRWGAALVPVYELELVERGEQMPPGLQRKHVFDFPDGLRLIVSKEREDQAESLHLSFGVHPDYQVFWDATKFGSALRAFLAELEPLGLVPGVAHITHKTSHAYHLWYKQP